MKFRLLVLATVSACLSQPVRGQDYDSLYCGNNSRFPHRLWITVIDQNIVQERDLTSGAVLATISRGLNGPTGLTISGGLLYVANSGGNNLTLYNSNLTLVQKLTQGISGPQGVAVDAYGDIYVANAPANNVVALRIDGSIAQVITQDQAGHPFNMPTPLSIISRLIYAGPVLVPPGVAVEGFNVGEFLTEPSPPVTGVAIEGVFQMPSGIASDSVGNIYVSDYVTGGAYKFSSTGKLLQRFQDPNGGFSRGVCVDPNTSDVYVSNGVPISSISVFNTDGVLINTFH